MTSYNSHARSKKYQKHENKINNLNGSTNHNDNEKSNKFVENNKKKSYKNNNIIITIKMA